MTDGKITIGFIGLGNMGRPMTTRLSGAGHRLLLLDIDRTLTESLAKELASRQVRVNAICPGFIATDMTAALPEKAREEYSNSVALGRFGSPEDVANLVTFLLSDASSYITGEVIKIDGGLYI